MVIIVMEYEEIGTMNCRGNGYMDRYPVRWLRTISIDLCTDKV